MSEREFRRAAVLARIRAREFTLSGATPLLGVSYRQAKRMAQPYRAHGRPAVVTAHSFGA
jgi:hypothetical protein